MRWFFRNLCEDEEEYREISFAELMDIVSACERETIAAKNILTDYGYLTVEIDKIEANDIYLSKNYNRG